MSRNRSSEEGRKKQKKREREREKKRDSDKKSVSAGRGRGSAGRDGRSGGGGGSDGGTGNGDPSKLSKWPQKPPTPKPRALVTRRETAAARQITRSQSQRKYLQRNLESFTHTLTQSLTPPHVHTHTGKLASNLWNLAQTTSLIENPTRELGRVN